jgi:Immunity protein Imm1
MDATRVSRISKPLLALLIRSFSTTSRPSSAGSHSAGVPYRAQACRGAPEEMQVNITLTLRAFNPHSRSGEDVSSVTITPSPEALDGALRRLRGDGTADLVLEHQGRRLYVAGGPEQFNVLADLGDDEFYDMIGDPSLRGWHPLLLGGQLTPTPQRHLVSLDDARRAALTFLEQGTIPLSSRWERQPSFEDE